MLKDVHVSHLTGTASILENQLLQDVLVWDRPKYTTGQMFFHPYESKKEFIFCARNTLQPIALIGLAVISPIVIATTPIILASLMLGFAAMSGIIQCFGNTELGSWAFDVAKELLSRCCQTLINLIVLPLTALTMLTRGISTGLKAAHIYDYDEPNAPETPDVLPGCTAS